MQTELKGWVIPTAVGVTSFALGGVAGYFFARYKQKSIDTEEIKEAIESQNVQMAFMFEEGDRKRDVQIQQANLVVKKLKEERLAANNEESIAASIDHHPSVGQRIDDDEDVSTVFRVVDETWDYDVEVPKRTKEIPYILHRDEYFEDELNYDNQTTLTYYEGDNVLCDENDTPIYNPEKIVGDLVFGKGSGDPNVVYIRNERLEAEYEVLLDRGYYVVEILGGQAADALEKPDLKHSVYKFRPE